MEKNLINAQKILMQMLQDDSVIRASEQKVYWNYGAYIEKLKNLDFSIKEGRIYEYFCKKQGKSF